jgi:hypothetical protein
MKASAATTAPAHHKAAFLRGCCGFALGGGLGLRRLADLKGIHVHGLGDVLELGVAEIDDLEIEPLFHLPIGILGQANCAGLGDAF